jgi:hypothetical protein
MLVIAAKGSTFHGHRQLLGKEPSDAKYSQKGKNDSRFAGPGAFHEQKINVRDLALQESPGQNDVK